MIDYMPEIAGLFINAHNLPRLNSNLLIQGQTDSPALSLSCGNKIKTISANNERRFDYMLTRN